MALKIVWKVLEECSSEDHSEDIKVGILRLLLNLIKLNNKAPTDVFYLSEYYICEVIESWCKKLQTKAVALVLSRWKDVASYFRNRSVDKVIDVMLSAITPEFLSFSMTDSIFEYLRGNFEHTADSCKVIEFFNQNDGHLEWALAEVMRNKDNYTPEALLYVAEMYHRNVTQSMKIPTDLIFSQQVEEAIIIALKGMILNKNTHDSPDNDFCEYRGSFLPYAYDRRRNVEWVFKALLDKPADMIENCYQFEKIMSLTAKTFSDDVDMMVAICSQSADSNLNKCKIMFGEHIIRTVRSRLFAKMAVLHNRPRVHREFIQEMVCVERYFSSYTVDGRAAYEQLLMDIKQKYKRKRKLMSMLGIA